MQKEMKEIKETKEKPGQEARQLLFYLLCILSLTGTFGVPMSCRCRVHFAGVYLDNLYNPDEMFKEGDS